MNAVPTMPPAGRGPAEHEVRDQIVAAAITHFGLYGYEKTTVSDLAKAIGFSKAYVYKFFASKQAIGEVICARCVGEIEAAARAEVAEASSPPEQLRCLFRALVDASLKLFIQDRKLYEIAASAATERWPSVIAYELRLQEQLREILQHGRASGDFERKTPMDETVRAIFLAMRPFLDPVMLQHSRDGVEEAARLVAGLVLRSLSP